MKKGKATKEFEVIERSLTKEYRVSLWTKFTKAIKVYDLLSPGDRVCCCISGGKDSMVMAALFLHLEKYSDFPFEVKYLVMDPGYSKKNREAIEENLYRLHIPATIVKTDIFHIANSISENPCYLCAKMRRGALYRIAKELGCNKIALGHHYDDVIETTLMNMLNSGSFQTMLPKLPSTNYEGMEIIRPMYLIREESILEFKDAYHLPFIQCACAFTEEASRDPSSSQRALTKKLIKTLREEYNPLVEKNIFISASNVTLDKIVGYKLGGEEHSFLDGYQKQKEATFAKIKEGEIERKAIEKAEREHLPLVFDETFNYRKK
ncbi:MAG: ATPase [Bacilli bacterium]|nr:ATPase [Bacilli bacterium]